MRVVAHLGSVAGFIATAIWLTFPLATHLTTAVPGEGPGDNLCFLWNTWWFRHSLVDSHAFGLWCPAVFAPLGTQLALHTHTLLEAGLSLLIAPAATAVAAHNVTIVAGLAANGALAYALAYHYTRRVLPSFIAGLMFGWSTFVAVHLSGHINLVHAWVLPLFAWCLGRFLNKPSAVRAAVVGGALAAVTYSDYYYAVYSVILALTCSVAPRLTIQWRRREPQRPRLGRVLLGLAVCVGVFAGVVAVTGGGAFVVGPWWMSIRSTRNLLPLGVLLLAAAGLTQYAPVPWRVVADRPVPGWRDVAIAISVLAILAFPIVYGLWRVIAAGDYVTQRILWRSSPAGIDLVTLALGPPRHLLLGNWVSSEYRSAGIDVVEQSGWLGVVAMVGVWAAARSVRRDADIRLWLIVGSTFLVLSLGPFLRVGGHDTGIPLPFALLRHVPILSNARMPGRAIVLVQLAAAILTALVIKTTKLSDKAVLACALAVVMDTLPHPVRLYDLPPMDRVDVALRDAGGGGSVLELPTGLRDGFGERGRLDHRMLAHQISHGRPLVGGFVARLSPAIVSFYQRSPFLSAALDASSADWAGRDCPFTAAGATALGIQYLVINRDALSDTQALSRHSIEAAGFHFDLVDGSRELYSTAASVR
jgi:hypothetical protein